MKVALSDKAFTPVTITLDNQIEVDFLSDALYDMNIDHFLKDKQDFLRTLRMDLYEYNTDYK
jgi:hypothetical protein